MAVYTVALWCTILGFPVAVFVAFLTWVGVNQRRVPLPYKYCDVPHFIVSEMNGRCLDVPWETDLDIVHMWCQHHSTNQRWLFCQAETNTYVVLSQLSGKCLEVVAYLSTNGAKVHQADYCGRSNQLWILTRLSNGCYRIHNKHSGKCLDVSNWEDRDGAELVQWTCHGEQNQLWRIDPPIS